MDFDSLKAVNGSTIKSEYSNKGETKKTEVSQEVSTAEKTKATDNSSQEVSKYTDEELYKGENFQQKMDKAISEANKMLEPSNKSFSYSIHKETNEVMIQIKDSNTGEVIKEIPSEESLDMVAKMRELAGIVIDEKR